MYRSKACLPFFSAVVKNIANPNVEVKKLVYFYLLHHAESEPDLALLSINTIQKSLTDQSPQIRAMALRVMSGIKVPVISQIVSLAIKRGIADMSPYVRKAAALAIPKCYRLDPNTYPQLLEYLSALLGDKQYFVVGPAVIAFLDVCPDRVDLIHKHYRALVRKLVDMDEWGQLATLRLLTFYSRKCFPRRLKRRRKTEAPAFYEEEGSEAGDDEPGELVQVLDPDLDLFIKACKPLLSSRSSAVIVATTKCLLYLGPPQELDAAIGPLVALMRSPQDVQDAAMYNIVAVSLLRPESFVRYATHFLVHSTDSLDIARLKFEVQTLIFPYCDVHIRELFLSELEHFTRSTNIDLVQESVRAIGRCALNDTSASTRCLRLLLQQISSQDGHLVAESLTVIRHLIQQEPQAHINTVIRLAKNLDTTVNPQARATIVWLVGEFAGLPDDENIAPDVLRILATGFTDEGEAAKLQIVLLAAKVYLHYLLRAKPPDDARRSEVNHNGDGSLDGQTSTLKGDENGWQESDEVTRSEPEDIHPIPLLWSYILQLTRYDTSYDLRDRARLYQGLLKDPSSTELASLLLLAPKPVPHAPSPSENRKGLLIGSSSLVIGTNDIIGYEDLPEWVNEGEEPDPRLREEAGGASRATPVGQKEAPAAEELDKAIREKGLPTMTTGAKDKSLDEWLNEESGEEEGSTEEETETEEESGDEEMESESGSQSASEDEGEGDRLVREA